MAIDRIGKSAPPAPSPETSGPAPTRETARPFEPRPSAARPTGSAAAVHAALEQLRTGQIDLHRYLDLKVEEATAHLDALPRIELDVLRAALRERLSTDPALVELVRAATGKVPGPPGDD